MRILKLTETWEGVRDMRCLIGNERRQNHVRMNSESESEELLRKPWQENHTRPASLRESESERRKELPGIKNDDQVAVRHADASGFTS